MKQDKDPLKIDLPDSDQESVKEDLISPKHSDNSSIKQYLPEVAKKIGSQANNNNNFPMPTAEEYYQMAATAQRLEAEAAKPPPPQHMSCAKSCF
ncbi:hypothetical protein H4Q26_002558 [Puccinia striiformis f. sp. tritici PST-130]|nr:hypothetical protein H4Q26_002558 [Puccinia striiformis f. sp. tritici PST-130]